jgi:hypothetical protein
MTLSACQTTSSAISHLNYQKQNAGNPWNLSTSPDPSGVGEDVVRFELRTHEKWKEDSKLKRRKYRSEISIKAKNSEHHWYKYSMYMPSEVDWNYESRTTIVMAQLHGGQYLDCTNQWPPMIKIHRGKSLTVYLRKESTTPNSNGFIGKCELSAIGQYSTGKLEFDRWHDFVYEVKYSKDEDGYVRMWVNGKQIIDYSGTFGYSTFFGSRNHSFKLGFYTQRTVSSPVISFYDNIAHGSGTLPEAVANTLDN